tara:strand:- start:1277 stop:2116 length:840 start_codon:yes stop_codon:yes gene_type:complete
MKNEIIIIGEVGINHNGSLKLAKELILMAKLSGCDFVKFQKRSPDITTPEKKKNQLRETPWGLISYIDYKKKIEFNEKQYDKIHEYSKKIKMKWFASAWDIESQKLLKKYKFKYNKIASAMITNLEFLEFVSKEKKTTLISTGMSTLKQIDNAVKIFKKNKCDFVLMHSVSSYPSPEKDLNLKMLDILKKKYSCKVGYSGHESTLSPTIGACYLGANFIERHITSDRTMWGTDQSASLSPDGLRNLVRTIKKIPKILGDGVKKITPSERKKIKDLRYWE